MAEGGIVKAIRIAHVPGCALGVQWHAEYDAWKNPVNRKLLEAFGHALVGYERRRALARMTHLRRGAKLPGRNATPWRILLDMH